MFGGDGALLPVNLTNYKNDEKVVVRHWANM